jgi:hypothetical protein
MATIGGVTGAGKVMETITVGTEADVGAVEIAVGAVGSAVGGMSTGAATNAGNAPI